MNNKKDNIELVKKLHRIWNTGELNLIPEVYSKSIIIHWPKRWGEDSKGLKDIESSIVNTRKTFLNWHEEILDIISDDEKVVTRYKSTGIHSQDYLGVKATNKEIAFEEISIYQIFDGKIIEQWCLSDDFYFLNQN